MLISCILPLLRIPNLLITLLEIKSLQSLHPGNQHWSDCFFSCLLILRSVLRVLSLHFSPSAFLPWDAADSLLEHWCLEVWSCSQRWCLLCTARTFCILCSLIAAHFAACCWSEVKLWPVWACLQWKQEATSAQTALTQFLQGVAPFCSLVSLWSSPSWASFVWGGLHFPTWAPVAFWASKFAQVCQARIRLWTKRWHQVLWVVRHWSIHHLICLNPARTALGALCQACPCTLSLQESMAGIPSLPLLEMERSWDSSRHKPGVCPHLQNPENRVLSKLPRTFHSARLVSDPLGAAGALSGLSPLCQACPWGPCGLEWSLADSTKELKTVFERSCVKMKPKQSTGHHKQVLNIPIQCLDLDRMLQERCEWRDSCSECPTVQGFPALGKTHHYSVPLCKLKLVLKAENAKDDVKVSILLKLDKGERKRQNFIRYQ